MDFINLLLLLTSLCFANFLLLKFVGYIFYWFMMLLYIKNLYCIHCQHRINRFFRVHIPLSTVDFAKLWLDNMIIYKDVFTGMFKKMEFS